MPYRELHMNDEPIDMTRCIYNCSVPWCNGGASSHGTCYYAPTYGSHIEHRDNMVSLHFGNTIRVTVCSAHIGNVWSRTTRGRSHRRCTECQQGTVLYRNQREDTMVVIYRQTRTSAGWNHPNYVATQIRGLCASCRSLLTRYCVNCGIQWLRAGSTVRQVDGESFCSRTCSNEYQEDRDEDRYDDDDRDDYGGGFVHYSHWRPNPFIFYPEVDPPKNKFYIGMEIEVGWSDGYPGNGLETWWEKWKETNTFWVVEDGSVHGFEVNTNPFNPDWALAGNFPFAAFDELVDKYNASVSHRTAGTHIHINKAAFDSAHLWKFLQLHQRMPNFCGAVGGRGTRSEWGSFGSDWQATRPDIAKFSKDKIARGYHRYVAVNLQNENTLEMRYMAGGTTSALIKKNMQWAKGLYEFTGELSVADVKDGALDHPKHMLGWMAKRKDQYTELIGYIANHGTPSNQKNLRAAMAAESVG